MATNRINGSQTVPFDQAAAKKNSSMFGVASADCQYHVARIRGCPKHLLHMNDYES